MNPTLSDSHHRNKMLFFSLIAAALLLAGFLTQPADQLFQGLYRINTSPSQLFVDFVAIGGFGAALVNLSTIILLELFIIKLSKARMTGTLLAAILTTMGFGLFGTSLFNMIPIILGVAIYARLEKLPFNTLLLQALLGSAIGPIINYFAFEIGIDPWLAFSSALLIGILIGMIIPPLSSAFLRFHQGYNLYNLGFTAGVIGLFAVGIMRYFDLKVEALSIYDTQHHLHLTLFALFFYLSLLLFGLILNGWKLKDYPKLLGNSGRLLADFVLLYGSGLTFFNMGLMGFLTLGFVVLLRGPINGPIIGASLTVAGFAAMGKHPRNTLPVIAGSSLAAILHGDIQSTSAIVPILFSTTVAPLTGQFGIPVGILAGYLHMAIVSQVFPLHAGLNLYNNGFSGGFVAAFLVPLIDAFRQLRERRAKHE